MKKFTAILLIMAMILSLAACSSNSSESTPTEDQPPVSAQEPVNSPAEDKNDTETPSENHEPKAGNDTETPTSDGDAEQGSSILVAYFSRVGNTAWEDGVDAVTSASLNVENGEYVGNAEYLAKMAQEATGGDLFLIQTEQTYPSAYRDTTDVAKEEQNADARPALTSHVENMGKYDTMILIYPNWWGDLPMPLYTFLEEYNFSGKTILPLCTHEGSRMGSSEGTIAALCPGATLLEGLAVRGSDAASAQSQVETWIAGSGILG